MVTVVAISVGSPWTQLHAFATSGYNRRPTNELYVSVSFHATDVWDHLLKWFDRFCISRRVLFHLIGFRDLREVPFLKVGAESPDIKCSGSLDGLFG